MRLLSEFAYGHHVGPLPAIAVVGLATYVLFLTAALIMVFRRWNRRFIRLSFKLHRWIAYAALALATFHLLLGLSLYV